jgi:cytochrome P450
MIEPNAAFSEGMSLLTRVLLLQDLFVAGSETSSTMLQWAMAELMRNPTVMRRAQEEVRRELAGHDRVTEDSLRNLHYMRLVIKETLRLHPAAPLLVPRECRSPCEVLGFDVPQGAMVLVNAWAIGRDPAHWDKPEEFVPERFEERGGSAGRDFKGTDFEFVPFGAGRRMCPGMAFGLAHIELALAALLFHFDWDLPEGMVPEELDMTEAAGITTRLRSDLLVIAVPRAPVPSE